jgi:hypothetical protein
MIDSSYLEWFEKQRAAPIDRPTTGSIGWYRINDGWWWWSGTRWLSEEQRLNEEQKLT